MQEIVIASEGFAEHQKKYNRWKILQRQSLKFLLLGGISHRNSAMDAHTKRLLTKRLLDKTSPNKTSPRQNVSGNNLRRGC
jgi:hypothetical protein